MNYLLPVDISIFNDGVLKTLRSSAVKIMGLIPTTS